MPYIRKPTIAAINGMAFGGGLELALMCDILLASKNAKIGLPEVSLGIMPGSGGTVRLTKATGKSKAMQMVLTGDSIDAQEALERKVISNVYNSQEELLQGAKQLARKIASKPMFTLGLIKMQLSNVSQMTEKAGVDAERTQTISAYGDPDLKQRTQEFLMRNKK